MSELRLQLVGCDAQTADRIRRRFGKDGVRIEASDAVTDLPGFFVGRVPDVVLLDADSVGDGLTDRLDELKRELPELPVIVVAGDAEMPLVVEAMRLGAFDVVAKPVDLRRLDIAIKNASQMHRLMQRVNQLQDTYDRAGGLHDMVGQSPQMRQMFDVVENVSRADVPVVITGESGTGKGLVAQAIHELSTRRAAAFVQLNCAAVTAEELESELFGHEEGAFPGANGRYAGCVEQADGGTLYLDELCDIDPHVQTKILRLLQTSSIQRMGSTERLPVSVRVVAATCRDPLREIQAGRLRDDLFYRLNVVPIETPPMRDRVGDVPLLAQHFLNRFTGKYGKYFYDFAPDALQALEEHHWPGNVRELENVVERIVVLNNASQVTRRMLPDEVLQSRPIDADEEDLRRGDEILTFTEIEKREIKRALRICDGNVSRAAERLGIGQATLYRKVKKYDIPTRRQSRDTVSGQGAR